MDTVRRLTLEAAQADTPLPWQERHRYEFAASLCADLRVLDLCCGSGYGSAILAAGAREVVGVGRDAAKVEMAIATIGRALENASFELSDPLDVLRAGVDERFDALVWCDGLDTLPGREQALALLREHAERGVKMVVSLANGARSDDGTHATLAAFPSTTTLPQFAAEGSLICPPGARDSEVEVELGDRGEPEDATHVIFCVNFDPAELERAHRGHLQVSAAPLSDRGAEELRNALAALRRENARLAREKLGKADSAAASALARLADKEARIHGLHERWEEAEARIAELEGLLAGRPSEATEPPEEVTVPPQPPRAAPASTGEHPNSWERRYGRAAEALIPWIEQTVPLAGKTVLEYGCGDAPVSCAFGERAARLIGVDIDEEVVEDGRGRARRRGLDNVELEVHPVESIGAAVAARRGEIDVFLLYAVLEHMTVAERLAVLELAREVVKPDGAIVVCETPNRLIYFDHHTAQMPFFHLLPDELALHYYRRSERADFKAAIDEASGSGSDSALEAIVRWGRGVSFHEFEVVFGDLGQHVVASNYDPLLFDERPVHPEEVILARYLNRKRPDLAPVFSRYWLDLILAPAPIARRPSFIRPWSADTVRSRNVGWTSWENLYLKDPDATLWVTLPHPTSRLLVGTVALDGGARKLGLHPHGGARKLVSFPHAPPGHTAFTSFALSEPAQQLALDVDLDCHVVFVGYED